ncbi:DUF1294 domain-containing protein [Jeotgalibacillus haloalkalitolerans]|uniref:DUF1294 domain-containing protein n=1 Tax=Jeotgalibacillus haloalkalitolerans TaxID=3104292 RepID=A0ABU5KNX4_9BACL|nr:DUF1294 domain-containing protein [Jeotgalibacillus sp. HH7-29]MDZ5712426.1 DUF1294 domain-containing protein [Jeotgalibacillus sp. HH7-29]
MESLLTVYYFILSVVGFISMRVDKKRARNEQYRISEKALWTIALLGGALGSWAGMNVFRHKTKHVSFRVGMPVLVILHSALIIWVIR